MQVHTSDSTTNVHFGPVYAKDLPENAIIICDNNILCSFFDRYDHVIKVNATEAAKSLENLPEFLERLFGVPGLSRGSKLVAVGGGAVQDLVSFVASILFRGVEWMFIPTTLAAMCDSCIGSKTSINFRDGKNQLGTYWPATDVYIDVTFLETLPEEQIRAGIGEAFHYAMLMGKDTATLLAHYVEEEKWSDLIKLTLGIKKSFVEEDEFDGGRRRYLNYGHCFGHALEAATGFSIPHGIAVAQGIDMANYISLRQGKITNDEFMERRKLIQKLFVQNMMPIDYDTGKLLQALRKDKKNLTDHYGVILVHDDWTKSKPFGHGILTYIKFGDVPFTKAVTDYKISFGAALTPHLA
jgi:3-dehydroquinate synthase